MASNSKKLLLLGATGFERNKEGLRLDCMGWEELGRIENVRDYDVLVLNLLKLKTEQARKKVDWTRFRRLFDFRATTDILEHEGKIVMVGDPRFEIPSEPIVSKPVQFLYWTGLGLFWDSQPGDTKEFERYGNDEFVEYLKHLHSRQYSLADCEVDESALGKRWNLKAAQDRGVYPSARLDAVCVNRYGHALAFRVWHQMADAYDRRQVRYGPIYFLPEVDLDEEVAVQVILRDFCDAAAELPEPSWVSSFQVPGQPEVDAKISKIQTVIAEQTAELEKAVDERVRVRTCLKLLYEREFGLEPVVRDAFRALGAKIEEPTEKNKEDGWLTVQVGQSSYEGVLEIKSTKLDQFGEDGRKQLLDWIDRGRTIRQKNYKGIFIGNSAVTKPLKDRPDAFSDSWKKAAVLSQICAMKSEHLYLIYILHLQRKLKLDDFWNHLFATNGAFDISPFLRKTEPAPTPSPSNAAG
jgi:hypothetical protein